MSFLHGGKDYDGLRYKLFALLLYNTSLFSETYRDRTYSPCPLTLYNTVVTTRITLTLKTVFCLEQWYSTFFVRVPPDIIYLQFCTPKVVGA
jgi:hypothetical protein